jgi:Arylsulfotransferase (ASST)
VGTGLAAAQSAPTCGPSSLNNSALQAGAVTVSPLPGIHDASPRSQLSFLGVPAGALSGVSAVGSRTGAHAGRMLAYSEGDGASFVPARPFAEGERVSVHARVRIGGATRTLSYQFGVSSEDAISSTPETIHPGSATDVQGFRSRPDLHPPAVSVTASSPATAPGDEFLAPYTGPGQAGPMILDPSGGLVWFKPLPTNTSATNFRVQEYRGKPVLTWWQGDISVHGFGIGEGIVDDSAYREIARVKAGNGHEADLHDFQLTPQGTALSTAYDPIRCNLSAVGGPADGAVTDGTLQEIDVKTGLVMYEWTSLDHVGLSESYESAARSSRAWPYDYFHVNSINLDRDGSMLLSARNTWTVYRIDAATGQISWRLGGKHSTFAEGPQTRTAYQHDPRELPGGAISIFDNGSTPRVHSQSRAIVVDVNAQSGSAALVGQLTHAPGLVANSQGNMQALANGDWFVGWGQLPDFSEFGPEGKLLFDAHFPGRTQSYRSFRFEWTGRPAHAPTYSFQAAGSGAGTVYASWNGATGVSAWRVLVGSSRASLKAVAEGARTGFETAIRLPAGTTGPYVAVQALGSAGQVLGSSAAVVQRSL